MFTITGHFSNTDSSLSAQLGVKEDQQQFYMDYSGEGTLP